MYGTESSHSQRSHAHQALRHPYRSEGVRCLLHGRSNQERPATGSIVV